MTLERFAALDAIPNIKAAFLGRVPGIDVDGAREEVLERLQRAHRKAADGAGFVGMPFATAEQVHGNHIAIIAQDPVFPAPGADGLITSTRKLCLAVYVADCAAVFLADRQGRTIALVHSGKKGTEQNIAGRAVGLLQSHFGIDPADLVAVISPCIRPPHYEIDFAAEIRHQLQGVGVVSDDRTCTASHPERYYSYRLEKGRTGRMLALLALG
ncbi:MAG: polyphenol oxidase family protein [Terrimicrobiaceae bacterium]